jgi:transposase
VAEGGKVRREIREQLVRERGRHVQRIQKVLEDAKIKLSSVISDVLGTSGRKILAAPHRFMFRLHLDQINRFDRDKLARRLVHRLHELGLDVDVRARAA